MRPGGQDHLHEWVYYLTAGFLFAAVVLRTLLLLVGPVLTTSLLLLTAWLVLLVTEPPLTRRWPSWFTVYLVLQCLLASLLLTVSDAADFFGILFAVLGMQAMQRYPPRWGAAALGVFVPVMALPMLATYEVSQALIFVIMYSAAALLVSSYSLATRRSAQAATQNRATVVELEAANRRVAEYSEQLERLAVTRERHRLAHDLHDSVTQTIFSMTLTTQTAVLLLQKDPTRVGPQLDRLTQLTRGALSEMQLLVSELKPERPSAGGFQAGLERFLAERAAPQGLAVNLEVEGEEGLTELEEQTLLRIAQEAVTNVIKHSGASSATIRLQLTPPLRLEVTDRGRGFASSSRRAGGGLGLESMRERAAEIGWSFEVTSSPEAGTRVVVQKEKAEEEG